MATEATTDPASAAALLSLAFSWFREAITAIGPILGALLGWLMAKRHLAFIEGQASADDRHKLSEQVIQGQRDQILNESSTIEAVTKRFEVLMNSYEQRIRDLTDEVHSLRGEVVSLRKALDSRNQVREVRDAAADVRNAIADAKGAVDSRNAIDAAHTAIEDLGVVK